MAEELLRSEGYTDVQYVKEVEALGTAKPLASGEADIAVAAATSLIVRLDGFEHTTIRNPDATFPADAVLEEQPTYKNISEKRAQQRN